jgi:hypothetical protein
MNHNLSWYVEYRNGSIIHQYDYKRTQLSFLSIDRTNLKRLCLTDGNRIIVSQDFIPNMSPIYRLRTLMMSSDASNKVIHIIGWVMWHNASNFINTNIMFIDDKSKVVEAGCFVEGEQCGYKYPIKFTTEDYIPIIWT